MQDNHPGKKSKNLAVELELLELWFDEQSKSTRIFLLLQKVELKEGPDLRYFFQEIVL